MEDEGTENPRVIEVLKRSVQLKDARGVMALSLAFAGGSFGLQKDFSQAMALMKIGVDMMYPVCLFTMGRMLAGEANMKIFPTETICEPMYQRAGELGVKRGVEGVGRCKNKRVELKSALKLYLIAKNMEGSLISNEG